MLKAVVGAVAAIGLAVSSFAETIELSTVTADRTLASGDVITVAPVITAYNGVRMTVSYEIREKKTGREVARAESKHCFTTLELRPVNMKKNDREINGVMEGLFEEYRKPTETEEKKED